MSSLYPPTNFVAKRKGASFLGADEDAESEHVVVTFSSTIVLIHPADNKVLKSWSCTRGRKNTATALFIPDEKEFVVVQNGNVLRTFSETDYEGGDSFTLNHKVHCLVRCHGHNPLVMLEDGSVLHLHRVLENPKKIVPDATIGVRMEEILYTCSFVSNSEDILVCSLCRAEKDYILVASKIHKEEDTVTHQHVTVKHEGRLAASCAYHKGKTPQIVTVWNDGSVCLLRPQFIYEGKLELKISKIATLEVDENVSITSISENQVAVLCKATVTILDLKFGTHHCKTCVNNSKVKLSTLRNHVILDMPGQLQKMPYSIGPVTLSSVLLKQKTSKEDKQQICAKWSANPTQTSLVDGKDAEFVQTLLKTEDESVFDKTWLKLWGGKSQHFHEQFSTSSLMRNILSRFQLEKEQMQFWPRSGLLRIISTDLINGRWCEGIVHHALNTQDWTLLLDCLKYLNDIPEEMMVACVTGIMGYQSLKMANGNGVESEDASEKMPMLCINQIFQLPYTENLLRKALTSLSFSIVLKLVSHLTSLMQELSLASSNPTLEQVISWLGMLLDAHLSEIMILEDSWPAILQLYEAVKLQSSVFKELSKVNTILVQIESKLLRTGKPKNFLYSVEIMQFY